MGGGGKKKPGSPGNPWTVLEPLRAALPSVPVAEKPPVVAPPPKLPARAVVRYERKGRGGKEATIVERLELAPVELERWCKDLKAALGCGGAVDGDNVVLQGDLRPRVAAWLTARGVKKVTVSG